MIETGAVRRDAKRASAGATHSLVAAMGKTGGGRG